MIERIFRSLYNKAVLKSAIKAGMKLGTGTRFLGAHDFGSEPYLIEIGNGVTVSSNVTFVNHDGATSVIKRLDEQRYGDVLKFGKIIIHDNCFIGTGTILLPGIEIGPNAVVGAGSVVTKNVEAGQVVAGSPAKPICTIEEYAEKCRKTTPDYDKDEYRNNKKQTVIRMLNRE